MKIRWALERSVSSLHRFPVGFEKRRQCAEIISLLAAAPQKTRLTTVCNDTFRSCRCKQRRGSVYTRLLLNALDVLKWMGSVQGGLIGLIGTPLGKADLIITDMQEAGNVARKQIPATRKRSLSGSTWKHSVKGIATPSGPALIFFTVKEVQARTSERRRRLATSSRVSCVRLRNEKCSCRLIYPKVINELWRRSWSTWFIYDATKWLK